jgi:hypothetical protein
MHKFLFFELKGKVPHKHLQQNKHNNKHLTKSYKLGHGHQSLLHKCHGDQTSPTHSPSRICNKVFSHDMEEGTSSKLHTYH